MANKSKLKENRSGGLYIALAVCILSVICVGAYSAVMGLVKPLTDGTELTENGTGSTPRVVVEQPEKEKPSASPDKGASEQVPPPSSAVTDSPVEEPDQSVGVVPVAPEFVLPLVGSVIKEFSDDMLVYSVTMNDYRAHNGVDMASVVGERVRALTDGVVEKVYEDPLMGQTVILDHGNGLKSVYQNLMPEVPDGVTEGAVVKAGDVIGGVGETALVECAQEPHLHFEVWRDGKPVNPGEYFN